ncbi:hypothetical protein FPV67DRAFT_1470214 [Lyophyllum atratum]|nr:hypothetical protein FPV67DRAFT_1470214 [Lyophyllum atratum]
MDGHDTSNLSTTDSDTSLIHSARSSGSRSSIYRTGPLDLNEEIPPSSDPAPSYSDEEEDNAEQDASSGFQFDWKKKLKEMDEQEDFDVDMVGVSHERDAPPPRIEPDDKSALSPQRPAITEELYVPTSSVDGGTDALTEDVFGPPSSNLIASSPPPHRSFGRSPSPKPVPSRRRINRILQDSEDEDDNNKNSSPTSPAFPHPITTPKPESSPTPPTSEDDMSTHARRDAKGKGKEKAAARPNVPPLRFSEALGSASAVKPTKVSSKNIRSKGQKIKV